MILFNIIWYHRLSSIWNANPAITFPPTSASYVCNGLGTYYGHENLDCISLQWPWPSSADSLSTSMWITKCSCADKLVRSLPVASFVSAASVLSLQNLCFYKNGLYCQVQHVAQDPISMGSMKICSVNKALWYIMILQIYYDIYDIMKDFHINKDIPHQWNLSDQLIYLALMCDFYDIIACHRLKRWHHMIKINLCGPKIPSTDNHHHDESHFLISYVPSKHILTWLWHIEA